MPPVVVNYAIQFTADTGEWVDLDESPVKLTAEARFREYRSKIPKTKKVRLVKRTEEVLGIRV